MKWHKTIKRYKVLYKRYSLLIYGFVTTVVTSFRLGVYYEKVVKEREIMEIENRHAKELLDQKEKYMEKYFELREKNVELLKRQDYGKGQ